MNDHKRARALGVTAGLFLALLAAALLARWLSGNDSGYAAGANEVARLALVCLVVIPLILFNIGLSFYLRKRDAVHGHILLWMWLPAVAASLLTGTYCLVTRTKDDNYRREHPPITEYHVNLSGRTFWLTPEVDGIGHEAGDFKLEFRQRTLENHDDPMTEYVGEHLAPGLKSLPIRTGEPDGVTQRQLPVVALPGPDLKLVPPAFAATNPLDLAYMYYHYPDRIEIAPTLNLHQSIGIRVPTAQAPLVYIFPRNLTALPIARLEIDGETVQLQEAAVPATEATYCKITRTAAINKLAAPIKVRWQVAGTAPAWREAMVPLPPLEATRETVKENALHLYFLPDGTVAAQRAQNVGPADAAQREGASNRFPDTNTLRVSDILPPFKIPPACGVATEAY